MEHASTGDGILTALEILGILARSGRPLSELARAIPLFPQQQRNVPVRHREGWQADRLMARAVANAEAELAGRGRVIVRPSGTESSLRIMIEGDDEARITELADALAALAAERLDGERLD
jgi:phosphoglucosamine mutase